MANTMLSDPLLAWLHRRSPPPWEKKVPVPQSAFSVSSKASSAPSSAFIDDPPQSPTSTQSTQSERSSTLSFASALSYIPWRSSSSPPPPPPPSPSPAQVHDATLRRLTGEDPPPSWFRRAPAKLIPALEFGWGPWRVSCMDLSTEAESRFAFRDRALTADEQRVARPFEISMAQQRRGWMPVMRRVWRRRLAAEAEAEAGRGGCCKWRRLPKMGKKTSPRPVRPPRPPPQVSHRYPLPHGRENHRSCCSPQTTASCAFCSRDGVKRAVLDNQI